MLHCSPLMIRRFCYSLATTSSAVRACSGKKALVFLGSPQVSVIVLDALLNASSDPRAVFEVGAIVTHPPSVRNRERDVPSPVAQHALNRGFPSGLIFTPEQAGEVTFLNNLRALQPELCITAAYGNILPNKFLEIPSMGTVNIHASLLPLYRGAAPIQRALQDGINETGVSLLFTIQALDAGPVITSERLTIDNNIKAPQLGALLLAQGSKLLIRELPSILDGSARARAKQQDDAKATFAPKIKREESWLSFKEEASTLHNKVRAFAGWPGTRTLVRVFNEKYGCDDTVELKIITTRVCKHREECKDDNDDNVSFDGVAMIFPCGGHTALEVLEVQLPNKNAVSSLAFWNGLRGQKLSVCRNGLVN